MKLKSLFNAVYLTALVLTALCLFTSCGTTCPDTQNLAYPQFYMAQDFMGTALREECTTSRMNNAVQTAFPFEWTGSINENDTIIYSFENDELTYFRLNHRGVYEKMYELFGKYLNFFELYGVDFVYTTGFNFSCKYLQWDVEGNLRQEVQIIARKTRR